MKNNFTHLLLKMTKFTLYGFIAQCLLLNILLAHDGTAQKVKSLYEVQLDVSLNNASFGEVLHFIEANTEYVFSYDEEDFKRTKSRISIDGHEVGLSEVLMQLSEEFKIGFKQINNNIYIKKIARKEPSIQVFLQTNKVTGRVTSATDNAGLPGVNVIVKGTNQGTITDGEGYYSINAAEDATLVFSFVGFNQKSVLVNGRSKIDVSLMEDISKLQEVLVVGYGEQEQREVTGSISSIKGNDVSKMAVPDIAHAMQGQAAGVNVVSQSGAPGSGIDVRIRGVGTINNTSPLYVVDGVPLFGSGVQNLNPDNIESIEVLKDASTASIYGARAANGVVLITTKRGKEGPAKVSFDAYYGTQSAWKTLDLLDREQYIDLVVETNENDDDPSTVAPPIVNNQRMRNGQPVDTDWQDEMFRPAPIQKYNLSISGGGENGTYNISGGYFDQQGIMRETGFNRMNIRVNSNVTAGKFKFGESLAFARSYRNAQSSEGGRAVIEHMIKQTPLVPVYDPDNLGGFAGPSAGIDDQDARNPVGHAELMTRDRVDYDIIGNVFGEYEIIDGLKFRVNLGTELEFEHDLDHEPLYEMGSFDSPPAAVLNEEREEETIWLVENILKYDFSLGDQRHNFDILAGYSHQERDNRDLEGEGEGFPSNDVRVIDAAGDRTSEGSFSEYAIQSIFGRVNYNYRGKYLLQANLRRDGSSRFGSENRYGIFPSASVGWRVSDEPFYQNVPDFLGDLKLKASYGELGNDRIPNYLYATNLNLNSNYVFGNQVASGAVSKQFPAPNIRWEETRQTDLGLELGLFDNRLFINTDYYIKETDGMLLQVPIPLSSGTSDPPFTNAGSVENRGFEVALSYRKSEGEFTYNISGNFSTYSNEVTSLGKDDEPIISGGTEAGDATKTEVGNSIGRFFGFETDGLYQSEAEIDENFAPNASPGDIRFVDQNNDGQLNDEDRVYIGSPLPDITYGLNASASYMNFDISVLLHGVHGNDIMNENIFWREGFLRNFNAGIEALDRWTPQNTDTDVPRAVRADPNGNIRRFSDRFIEDGSYMRIRNLTIGYTFPAQILETLGGLSKIRIYGSSQNLLTITNYSGYDPEIGAKAEGTGSSGELDRGIDNGVFPQARSFLMGLQVTF